MLRRMARAILKLLAVAVALLFLGGAVLTAAFDVFGSHTAYAEPVPDAGAPRLYFHASKSAPLQPPRRVEPDAGPSKPVSFPASKSAGGEAIPGTGE